jgi:hypothetical protein
VPQKCPKEDKRLIDWLSPKPTAMFGERIEKKTNITVRPSMQTDPKFFRNEYYRIILCGHPRRMKISEKEAFAKDSPCQTWPRLRISYDFTFSLRTE